MDDGQELKHWRDAGHVARRTLEGVKEQIQVGKCASVKARDRVLGFRKN